MKLRVLPILIAVLIANITTSCSKSKTIETDVLVIGGGASGVMAGIQSARMGVKTMIMEETPWLGGMLTSAGVSAVDGNYDLNSGLWHEFRLRLEDYYGGKEQLKTGWVSHVLFEPNVGAEILFDMASQEENLKLEFNSEFQKIAKTKDGWLVNFVTKESQVQVKAKLIIDATELGDVAKSANIPYDIGMDSRFETKESIAPEEANDIVQDLTYVVVLKDYGKDADVTIEKPEGYNPTNYYCSCSTNCDTTEVGKKVWDCESMLTYGKLPNGYYMINWPINGNDYYLNILELSKEERKEKLKEAKNYSLGFIYYIQNELGYKNLGIADIYPTKDSLPFIPYHRESRRIKGMVRLTLNDVAKPYEQESDLYRTGIAVGDYAVDHHHHAYPESEKLPDLHFYPIPSYSIPLGSLIPKNCDNFIVAEKSISVSNLINGTTRLQPVCLLIGQAAGTLAAISVNKNITPKKVNTREVQRALLNSKAYILPYSDIDMERPSFTAIQRIGATGILRGEGKNVGWKNRTLIYPDSLLKYNELSDGLNDWLEIQAVNQEFVTLKNCVEIIKIFADQYNLDCRNKSLNELIDESSIVLKQHKLPKLKADTQISREVFAVLIDHFINPFELRQVDLEGQFKQ